MNERLPIRRRRGRGNDGDLESARDDHAAVRPAHISPISRIFPIVAKVASFIVTFSLFIAGLTRREGQLMTTTAAAETSNHDVNEYGDPNVQRDSITTVFIGIKVGDPLGERYDSIRRTWLQDALEAQNVGKVKINFFSTRDKVDEALAWNGTTPRKVTATNMAKQVKVKGGKKLMIETFVGDRPYPLPIPAIAAPLVKGDGDPSSIRSLFVTTNCTDGDLRCGTSSMFAYYLEHHVSDYSYFCSFDDDQYVLVANLLSALKGYGSRNVYVGNSPFVYQSTIDKKSDEEIWKGKQRFLTGGAGYCLSRDLILRGWHNFTNLPVQYRNGDDVAVGHIVEHDLGVSPPVEDRRFHSHFETRLRKELRLEDIARQVAFGYDMKANPAHRLYAWPNIPLIFPEKEDPLRFRSLRCFLLQIEAESARYPSECERNYISNRRSGGTATVHRIVVGRGDNDPTKTDKTNALLPKTVTGGVIPQNLARKG